MAIKAECLQNECLVDRDYVFQVRVYEEADDSAYTPTAATVRFLKQDATVILDTVSMAISDTNLISYTLAAAHLDEPAIYNVAVVTVTKDAEVYVLTFIFHIVKQIITNPLLLQTVYDQYNMIEQHPQAAKSHKKIIAAFKLVKADMVDKKGLEYSLGMIDSAQIEELVLQKTVELISRDFAAGSGMNDENYWYKLLKDSRKDYQGKIENLRLVYDSTLEEHVPDVQRTSLTIACHR